MTETDLVERLSKHRTLGAAPREELAWLAARGHVRRLAVGEQLAYTGMPVEGMYAILSGRMAIFLDRGGAPKKLADWQAGDVTGLLPYSRLVNVAGELVRGRSRPRSSSCPASTCAP